MLCNEKTENQTQRNALFIGFYDVLLQGPVVFVQLYVVYAVYVVYQSQTGQGQVLRGHL